MTLDPLALSRVQFGFTVTFHIVFPAMSIGLAGFLVLMERLWLRTRDPLYLRIYRFWQTLFAMGFGVGVVTGIVLSFQFGTNFARFAQMAGPVIGPMIGLEVRSSFFLEAGFLGIMLFGMGRVGPRLHFFATCMVALGTMISSTWIMSANSWMQTPDGFALVDGRFVTTDWWRVVFNPSFLVRLPHMLLAAYVTGAFLVSGVAAYDLLRGRHLDFARRTFSIGLGMASVLIALQLFVGDIVASTMAEHQPGKFNAIEGHWEPTPSAPYLVFIAPDQAGQRNRAEWGIPWLGSVLITHSFTGTVHGLKETPVVQAAINAAGGQLPGNLPSPPTYRKVNPADAPILVMAVSSNTLPITQVNDYADNILSQQLSRVSGVGLVSINGQQKPAVRIQLDPAKLAAIGLGLDDVRAVLATVTVNAPKGIVDGPQQSFTVYDNDQLTAAAPWQDVIVAWRGGAPVRVRDLGQAVDGAENTKLAGWAGKKPAIILAVSKLPGANVIATVDAIQGALPRLRAAIPPAVDVQILTDRTQTIRASVSDVETTLAITVGLVVAVIFVFLRTLPGTLIPAAAVPLSLTGTFGVMAALGYSLDTLSLMGLSIAIGFVVDDAIVMLENIYRHIEEGTAPMEAALKGAGEIGFTIVSISLSLVAVFIPLLLMGGIVGRLFREFAVTVTATILISGLVSLTLTPMLCARLLRDPRQAPHGRLYALSERLFGAMQDRYGRALDVALRRRLLTLPVFLGTLGLTGWLYAAVPKGFFPQQDTGFIFGQVEGNQEISSAAMKERAQAVAALVGEDPDVASFACAFGATTFNQANLYINLSRAASAGPLPIRWWPGWARACRRSKACAPTSRSARASTSAGACPGPSTSTP